MRVIGYARVSTDEQATSGVSLEAQAEKIRQYAALYALDLVAVVSASESAKSLERDGLRRALGMLDQGDADGLVVAKLDRLTRSVVDLGSLLQRYFGDGARCHLFSVADAVDTRTAAGRLVLNVIMSVAQWERETNVERTRDALAHKRARGERTGGIPYGWDLDPSGPLNAAGRPARLVVNAAEATIVARILELAAAGRSPRAIAGELERLGVPTKLGRGPWRHSAVTRILARARAPEPHESEPR